MIVSCPSCQTRYRHHQAIAGVANEVQCSECEEQFEPRPARCYVLVPQAGRVRIGMDDPLLADQISPDAAASVDLPACEPAAEVAAPAEVAPEAAPEAAPQGASAAAYVLATTVPAGLGGAVAYYLAVSRQADPITWAVAGAAVGFVLGWCCLQWTQTKD